MTCNGRKTVAVFGFLYRPSSCRRSGVRCWSLHRVVYLARVPAPRDIRIAILGCLRKGVLGQADLASQLARRPTPRSAPTRGMMLRLWRPDRLVGDVRVGLASFPRHARGRARASPGDGCALVRPSPGGYSGRSRQAWVSGLTCRRRPGNRPCRGYMVVARPDSRPGSIKSCSNAAAIKG